LWGETKPRHHTNRARRNVPRRRTGEQSSVSGVRAD
jgi:hypothetical protein